MFTNKIDISEVHKRVEAIRDESIDSSYFCFQFARRNGSIVGDNYSVTFEEGVGYALIDRFDNELVPVREFINEFGAKGKNTLMAFAGTISPDAQKAWDAIASRVDFVAIEFTIMHDVEGLDNPAKREHFLFIAFDQRSDLILFKTIFGYKKTEEVLEYWEEPSAPEPSELELELLKGIDGLT